MRVPFVLTVSSLSAVLACSSQVVIDQTDSPGGGGGSPTTSAGGNETSGSSSGGAGGHDAIICPDVMPGTYELCPEDGHPGVCQYDVACQSGIVSIAFQCTPGSQWTLVPAQACDYPHDSCAGTELYCQVDWWMPEATNPPSACPSDRPTEFAACNWGQMGGVHQKCGYACNGDVRNGWTVATCTGEWDEEGQWEYDGVCAP